MATRYIILISLLINGFSVLAMADEKPNIVVILMDDAGINDLSCYGQQRFETPHIDRMAREGLRFTQHYAGSTVCAPTRSVIMSGLHTGHTPIRGNRAMRPEGQHPLPADTETIAELLAEVGYRCGAFGKWGLGPPASTGDPNQQGFHEFYGYNCQREAHSYYPSHLWHNENRIDLDGTTYAHDLIMDQAIDFIKENRDRPFFCFVPVTIPHASMHVPEAYSAPFRKKFSQFEDLVGKYKGPHVRNPIAAFAGMMTKLDEGVGRIAAVLNELEIDEKTLVVISSDNGPHREGGHDPVFFDSNGMFRGFKRDLYEGGIRVPLVVRWPGQIQPGRISPHICAQWDWLPTICELAGRPVPPHVDGISFRPTLLGHERQRQHEYLYWEFHEQGGKRAVRIGDWKAIELAVKKPKQTPIQLFDLKRDPGEQHDLARQHPDLIVQVQRIFEKAHSPSPVWKLAKNENGVGQSGK